MNYTFLLLLLTAVSFVRTLGQGSSLDSFIDCVESQNGADNLLTNGRPYRSVHLLAEGHPYFLTEEWKPGIVYIGGISFPVNGLKYNLMDHQLILKHELPSGVNQSVALSDLLIDSFYIESNLFVSWDLILSEMKNKGYLEVIFTDQLSFYRLQKKVFESRTNNLPNGRFSKLKDVFYLLLNDKSYKITQKKELLAHFPNSKIQIKAYMKQNDLKWKKMTKTQLADLLKFCYDQI